MNIVYLTQWSWVCRWTGQAAAQYLHFYLSMCVWTLAWDSLLWQQSVLHFFSLSLEASSREAVCVCAHVHTCGPLLEAAVEMSEGLISRDDSIKPSSQQLCCLLTASHKHCRTYNNIGLWKVNHSLKTETTHVDMDGCYISFHVVQ